MTVVVITSVDEQSAQRYVQALNGRVQTRVVTPKDLSSQPETLLREAGGLLLAGGPGVDPHAYGDGPDPHGPVEVGPEFDTLEQGLLRHGLALDMPVLAICRGMHRLNVAFGGSLLQDISGHRGERNNGGWTSAKHSIYLSPGSKLAAILGMGGFFKVNSLHHQGLREAQKSPRLLASAYSLEDGLIEGLESPEHSWVVGVQCDPEIQEEVPKVFGNIFMAFTERAEGFVGRAGTTG